MAPLTTSSSSSSTNGGLSERDVSLIVAACFIFMSAFALMGCVYSKRMRVLRSCTVRRPAEPLSPALASSRRRSGASSPTSTLSYTFSRLTDSSKKGTKDDISMYSRETIHTPPPTYRPHTRPLSYETHVPVTSTNHFPVQNNRTLIPQNWPIAFKLAGGRPCNGNSTSPVADLSPGNSPAAFADR